MIGAVLALIGATLIGAGLARQHAAAGTVEEHAAMDPRLFLKLMRRKSWLIGVALANGGFVFIASGIATGRLSIVEPIGATQVLFALFFAARASGRHLSRPEWIAAGAALAGVGGFLVVAAPQEGASIDPAVSWSVPIVGLVVLVVAGLVFSRALSRTQRGVVLAALAGLTFGTSDALIKVMSDHGAGGLVTHWSLYAWMAAGTIALLLQQSAYQATHLGAAMPATSTLAPTTATLLGAAMLGEQLRGGWAVPVEIALFGLLLMGVARLAASPVLSDDATPAVALVAD
ncbi:MAG TPA: DMT family transporter [Acidimicrobiales bacterium]|nr:DMT family transporter [Acidimicrobiales bacterium]